MTTNNQRILRHQLSRPTVSKAEQRSRDFIMAHREMERRVDLLKRSYTFRDKKSVNKDYGHIGTIREISRLLGQALHYAGVEEFVEK